MNPIVEALACFLGFLGWLMVGVALPHRYWRESTVDGNVITTSTIYENLWMSCATDSTGVHNCRDFPSLLALSGIHLITETYFSASASALITWDGNGWGICQVPLCLNPSSETEGFMVMRYIQASRALMIASILCGAFGLMFTLAGMQCSKVCGENYILKGKIAAIGGIFFLLQGTCTMIAISWYAANITQQFFDQLYAGTKYEIGQGLYIGWSSGVLAICAGSCLLCSCRMNSTTEKVGYPYQPSSGGRVLSAVPTSQRAPSNYDRNAYV